MILLTDEQLSLFDFLTETETPDKEPVPKPTNETSSGTAAEEHEMIPYEIGDKVRVNGQALEPNDTENYYYLIGYKNKRGVVQEVNHFPRLQYRVSFGKEDIYVYHEELTL